MCTLDKKGLNPDTSPFLWAAIAVFLAFMMDRILIMLSLGLQINKNLSTREENNKSTASYAILHVIFSIILLTAVIYFSGKFLHFWYKTLFPPNHDLVFSLQFLGLIGGYLFYIMARFPLKYFFNFISSPLNKVLKLPTYRLLNEGIEINFNTIDLSNSNKQYTAFLSFKDIERIQILTYMDALAYFRYQINPDMRIQAMKNSLMVDGKQPDYYISSPAGNGTNILIEGANIFYFLCLKTKDARDLTTAFQTFKKQMSESEVNPES
ncbi:hypothetical protein ACD661_11775 [Legionella lytica]|uniref:Transmembrane protein n=1 Tax=Legionella lytica TaxID=96232 RepID=A0ABW8DDD1_9GAMM